MKSRRREQLDALVRQHLADMLTLAQRLTGDLDKAEEIVQESMFRATKGWQRFRGAANPKTWLYQIVINTFRSSLKQRSTDSWEDQKASNTRTPLQIAEQMELEQIVANHVSSLPPRQREVLILITYENFDVSQVAEMLEMNSANVYSTLHHARSALKKSLNKHVDNLDWQRK